MRWVVAAAGDDQYKAPLARESASLFSGFNQSRYSGERIITSCSCCPRSPPWDWQAKKSKRSKSL